MANQYNFDANDLQLDATKVAQFTKALGTAEDADPLQTLCDEAADKVARLTAGYLLSTISILEYVRALAVFNAYVNSGSPAPPDVATRYKSVETELQSISRGDRPNLPKVPNADLTSRAGKAGSRPKFHGRMGGGFGAGGGGI